MRPALSKGYLMLISIDLRDWCIALGTALTERTGYRIIVSAKPSALQFECEWEPNGTPIIAWTIQLDRSPEYLALHTTPETMCAEIWAMVGSWADFHLYWLDEERETAAA